MADTAAHLVDRVSARSPFTVKGKKVRLKGTTFMASPLNSRVRTEISEGNDPFVNLGTVWMQRQGASAAK